MSWRDRLPSTRSGNPNFTSEAREQRRLELEEKRLQAAKKRQARKDFLAAGISAPPSPSTSRVPSPVREHLASLSLPLQSLPDTIDDDLLSLPGDIVINNMAELFEDKTAEDDKEAWKKTITSKFDKNDVEYFFTDAEAQMKRFGINKQLSK